MSLERSYRDIIAHVQANVIGQDRAIQKMERALKIAQAGIRDTQRPLAILLFAGPTGTGKTEFAEVLAEAIHGDRKMLCRVDFNLLTESHTASSLTGSPAGYIGSPTGDTIIDKKRVEGKPGKPGILVCEEFEKGHPKVHDVMLGIFDKGLLHLNNGKDRIDFTNTIIVLTSNAGARALSEAASGRKIGFAAKSDDTHLATNDERLAIVMNELKILFRPEFLNRLDDTVVFEWLDRPQLDIIVSIIIDKFSVRLAKLHHCLNVEPSAKDFLVTHGTDVANGARPLKRAITRYLEDPLAEIIVDAAPNSELTFQVSHEAGKPELTIKFEVFIRPDPPKEEAVEVPALPEADEAPQAAEAPVIDEEPSE